MNYKNEIEKNRELALMAMNKNTVSFSQISKLAETVSNGLCKFYIDSASRSFVFEYGRQRINVNLTDRAIRNLEFINNIPVETILTDERFAEYLEKIKKLWEESKTIQQFIDQATELLQTLQIKTDSINNVLIDAEDRLNKATKKIDDAEVMLTLLQNSIMNLNQEFSKMFVIDEKGITALQTFKVPKFMIKDNWADEILGNGSLITKDWLKNHIQDLVDIDEGSATKSFFNFLWNAFNTGITVGAFVILQKQIEALWAHVGGQEGMDAVNNTLQRTGNTGESFSQRLQNFFRRHFGGYERLNQAYGVVEESSDLLELEDLDYFGEVIEEGVQETRYTQILLDNGRNLPPVPMEGWTPRDINLNEEQQNDLFEKVKTLYPTFKILYDEVMKRVKSRNMKIDKNDFYYTEMNLLLICHLEQITQTLFRVKAKAEHTHDKFDDLTIKNINSRQVEYEVNGEKITEFVKPNFTDGLTIRGVDVENMLNGKMDKGNIEKLYVHEIAGFMNSPTDGREPKLLIPNFTDGLEAKSLKINRDVWDVIDVEEELNKKINRGEVFQDLGAVNINVDNLYINHVMPSDINNTNDKTNVFDTLVNIDTMARNNKNNLETFKTEINKKVDDNVFNLTKESNKNWEQIQYRLGECYKDLDTKANKEHTHTSFGDIEVNNVFIKGKDVEKKLLELVRLVQGELPLKLDEIDIKINRKVDAGIMNLNIKQLNEKIDSKASNEEIQELKQTIDNNEKDVNNMFGQLFQRSQFLQDQIYNVQDMASSKEATYEVIHGAPLREEDIILDDTPQPVKFPDGLTTNKDIKYINTESNESIDIISKLKDLENRLDNMHPVGSIYVSMNSRNPKYLFGGEWTQIVDRFLYCANSSNQFGGSKLITGENLPAHSHLVNLNTSESGNHSHKYEGSDIWVRGKGYDVKENWAFNTNNPTKTTTNDGRHTHNVYGHTQITGQGKEYMPPYITVYAWYRVE